MLPTVPSLLRPGLGRALPILSTLSVQPAKQPTGPLAARTPETSFPTRLFQPSCAAPPHGALTLWNQHLALPAVARSCRWVAEAQALTPQGHQDASAYLPPATRASQHIMDTPEKAIEVRMESQVVFDSCWRRFEERFRLQASGGQLLGRTWHSALPSHPHYTLVLACAFSRQLYSSRRGSRAACRSKRLVCTCVCLLAAECLRST